MLCTVVGDTRQAMTPRRRRERRDRFPIARSLPFVSVPSLSRVAVLTPYEDRRTFVFKPAVRPAFALPRSASRLVVADRHARSLSARVAFAMPKRVAVCVRRQRRKEVLFAHGVGGSRRAKRRPRRSMFSDVSC